MAGGSYYSGRHRYGLVSVPEIRKEVAVTGNIIELTGLTRRYGQFTAVDNLNLNIKKGEIFGLLGPNGAGKSTTILMILGLTEPDEGRVTVCGLDPTASPVEVKRRVGYLPEEVGFYDDLTGLENLVYTACLNGMTRTAAREKATRLLERVGLAEHLNKKTGKYSRGMRQRLGLADVLIKEPEVIILDEPTLGIDPAGVREFLELIAALSHEQKITVLFSSHHLHQVQQVCDRVGLFVGGRLLAVGDIQDLASQLFGEDPYTVEVGISSTGRTEPETEKKDEVIKTLRHLDGVKSVREENGRLLAACSADLTDDIVHAVLNSGVRLVSLNMKSYGLDDIYYHYFEGGDDHE
jgi:ABC-2 type transport system ATP-binding protein